MVLLKKKCKLLPIGVACWLLFGTMNIEAAVFSVHSDQPENGKEPIHQHGKCPHMMGNMVGDKLLILLKMDSDAFHQELAKGKCILQIAEEKGVKKQELVDLIVKEMTVKLDEEVKAGKISKEKAAWVKKYLPVRAEMWITKPGHVCPHADSNKLKQHRGMVE